MRTEIPAYLIAGLIVLAATVLTIHGDSVPNEFYAALFGALGIAGGVSVPRKAEIPPEVPPTNG